MYSVYLRCNLQVPRRSVGVYCERLREEIEGGFGLYCQGQPTFEAGDSSRDEEGVDLSWWFLSSSVDYDPAEAARVAERIADEVRLMAMGRASIVRVGFWDAARTSEIDDYSF